MEDALFLFCSIYISYTMPTAVAFFPPVLSKCAYFTRLGVYVPPERAGICRPSEAYYRTLSGAVPLSRAGYTGAPRTGCTTAPCSRFVARSRSAKPIYRPRLVSRGFCWQQNPQRTANPFHLSNPFFTVRHRPKAFLPQE